MIKNKLHRGPSRFTGRPWCRIEDISQVAVGVICSFPMKLVSWNVRGLGRSEKMRQIKLLLKQKGADMVFLQETKQTSISITFVKSLWHGVDMDFMDVSFEGAAGGSLCI